MMIIKIYYRIFLKFLCSVDNNWLWRYSTVRSVFFCLLLVLCGNVYANVDKIGKDCASTIDDFLKIYIYSEKYGVTKWTAEITYKVVNFTDQLSDLDVERVVRNQTDILHDSYGIDFKRAGEFEDENVNLILIIVDTSEKAKRVLFNENSVNLFGERNQNYEDYIEKRKKTIDEDISNGIIFSLYSSDIYCCNAAILAVLSEGDEIVKKVRQAFIGILIHGNKSSNGLSDLLNDYFDESFLDIVNGELINGIYSKGFHHGDPVTKLIGEVSPLIKEKFCK
ncbi:hypothetical protein KQ940_07190 [Marinobacterium sp. D7]|uniref:hypothetical protein n=1 Tax=Marinobacterium ramblicola TaxID=2849041 RepID=UPI001C2D4712|nr:hypothetical protein [Marinobacterium ramblicola]MBV1787839.1 hypothetical protein [Marinobacterium ramblicola]